MIVVTGAAGFIGSCMVNKLNQNGFQNLVLVDKFTNQQKNKNLEGKSWDQQIDRDVFIDWLDKNAEKLPMYFILVPEPTPLSSTPKCLMHSTLITPKISGASAPGKEFHSYMPLRQLLMAWVSMATSTSTASSKS